MNSAEMVGQITMSSSPPTPNPAPFGHKPVMVNEIRSLTGQLQEGYFLDATVGGGGHSQAILEGNSGLAILGIDQDPIALAAADKTLAPYEARVQLYRRRFDQLVDVLMEAKVSNLSGFLFDLGVSSPQLDVAERGFSFRNDGPLDMRMDPNSSIDASSIVNEYDEKEIATVLREYGDERYSSRIAKAIVAARPLSGTTQLSQVIVQAIPAAARRTGGHPAKRSFQALRIEVNSELQILAPALEAAIDSLGPGGRGFVLTYHSGEDRIVKKVFRERTTQVVPNNLPVEPPPLDFKTLRPLALTPTEEEVAQNRRASSARLRTIERSVA